MKIIKRLFDVLAIFCYVLILGVLFVAAPMATGYKPVVVLTGSMEPSYGVGSVLYYKPAAFSDIQVGDVITYSLSDDATSVVTHRVYEKSENDKSFVTKGDANASPDASSVAYANVKGEVMSYHLPLVGYFIQYVQNLYIILAVFFVLISKVVIDYLIEHDEQEQLT